MGRWCIERWAAVIGLALVASACAEDKLSSGAQMGTDGAEEACGDAQEGCVLECPVPTQVDWVVYVQSLSSWPLVVGGEGELIIDSDPDSAPDSRLARLDVDGVLTTVHDLQPGDAHGWRWGSRLVTYGDWSGDGTGGWDEELAVYDASATPTWSVVGLGHSAPLFVKPTDDYLAVYEDTIEATDSPWARVEPDGTATWWPDEGQVFDAHGPWLLRPAGLFEADGHELVWATDDETRQAEIGTDVVARLAWTGEGDHHDLELRDLDGTVRWRVPTQIPPVWDLARATIWLLPDGDVMVFDYSREDLRFARYRGADGERCGASVIATPPEVLEHWRWSLWAEPDGEGGFFFSAVDAVGHVSP